MGTDDYEGHWNMMDGSGGGWVMVLVMLLVLLALGLGLAYVARLALRPAAPASADAPRPESGDEDRAAGILRERLARGEIDGPEYESRLRTIRQR
jgi:uncharacterized membrane protein